MTENQTSRSTGAISAEMETVSVSRLAEWRRSNAILNAAIENRETVDVAAITADFYALDAQFKALEREFFVAFRAGR